MESIRNVEIKLRFAGTAADIADRLSAHRGGKKEPDAVLDQTDTYFACRAGRLKLRTENAAAGGQLIFYARPDEAVARISTVSMWTVDNAAALKGVLQDALGVRAVVEKTRLLFMAGRTRVHVDAVRGLGAFLEIEVVMRPGEPTASGHAELQGLIHDMGLEDCEVCKESYVDMIEALSPTIC